MSRKKKSRKRVKAGKEAAKTRAYHGYLAEEKERRETPFRFRMKQFGRGIKRISKRF